MITLEQAKNLTYRTVVHHLSVKNADRTPLRGRVNGKCQTWKTRPNEFRLPMKYGLKQCFYITDTNCGDWNLV